MIAFILGDLGLDEAAMLPGHGPIEPKAKLQDRLRAAEERRAAVEALIKALVAQGKSLDDVTRAVRKAGRPALPDVTGKSLRGADEGLPAVLPAWPVRSPVSMREAPVARTTW